MSTPRPSPAVRYLRPFNRDLADAIVAEEKARAAYVAARDEGLPWQEAYDTWWEALQFLKATTKKSEPPHLWVVR